MHTPT